MLTADQLQLQHKPIKRSLGAKSVSLGGDGSGRAQNAVGAGEISLI